MEQFLNILRNIYINNVWTILVPFAIVIVILIYEAYILGWNKSSFKNLTSLRSKSGNTDIVVFLMVATKLDVILTFILTLGISNTLPKAIRRFIDLDLSQIITSPVLHAIIFFIIFDFFMYINHYFLHKIPLLWEFHKFHHSANEFNVITFARKHPFFAKVWAMLVLTVPLTLIGTPIKVIVLIIAIRQIFSALHHSKLDYDFGWFGKYIFVSPQYHKIHHSEKISHHDANYASIFIIWDILFKTRYTGSVKVESLGIEKNDYNQSPFKDIVRTFKDVGNYFIRLIKQEPVR